MSKLVKNTSLYTIGNIIPKIAGFFLLPIYTKYLGPEEYGIVQSMQVLSAILILLFTLSIDRAIFRLYFDFKDKESRTSYISTIVISLSIISVIILALLFLFQNAISHIYSSISFYPYYSYAILTAFFTIYGIIPKIYFQIKEQAGKFITISILQFVFNTGFVLWFVVAENQGAVGMLRGFFYAALIMLPIFIPILIKIINFKFNLQYIKDSLKFSLPMLPSVLAAWILNLSDRIFIEHYFSMSEVGIYSLGYKIAGLLLIVASAFNLAYNPVFYKLANSDNQKEAKLKLQNYNYIYMLVLFVMTFLIVFFSKEVLELFFNNAYIDAYKIIYLIALAYLISQITALFNLSVYQAKKTIVVMYIIIGSALLNILLNYLLIPIYGMYGAAYATIISFIANFLLMYFYAQKYYPIVFNWKAFLSLLSLAVFFMFIFSIIPLATIYVLVIKFIFVLIVSFVLYKKYFKTLKMILKEK